MKIIHTQSSVGLSVVHPINWMPDDLVKIHAATASQSDLIVPRFISIPNLFDFVQMIREKQMVPLSLAGALPLTGRLEKHSSLRPFAIAVEKAGIPAFLGLYDYPNYRFLDWICPDIDIRLTSYLCVVSA